MLYQPINPDLNSLSDTLEKYPRRRVLLFKDKSVFAALKTDINSAKIDDKLKPILRFIKKLTLTPDQITQADVQQIFDAGWDEYAYFDSVCICAIMNCMNRFVTAIGIDATQGERAVPSLND